MIISLLHSQDLNTSFIDLHVEQTFENIIKAYKFESNLSKINKETELKKQEGIYINEIYSSSLKEILTTLSNNSISLCKFVVINFNNLIYCQRNLFNYINQIIQQIETRNSIPVLINIDKNLYNNLDLNSISKKKEFNINDNKNILVGDANSQKELIKLFKVNKLENIKFNEKIKEVFYKELIKTLNKSCVSTKPKDNPSSQVRINKYINIKKFAENNLSFFYYCNYQLASKLINGKYFKTMQKIEKGSKYILFCQTLNGSIIASILSDLLSLDISYLDHIGPVNKLYAANFGDRIKYNRNYFIIADVICFGTETKIAKNIIEYSGGNYSGNISFVRIKTINENIYNDDIYLMEISKEKNDINYKITVDL